MKKKEIEIVPRVQINGVLYLMNELPEGLDALARKTINDRIDLAMQGLGFVRKETA